MEIVDSIPLATETKEEMLVDLEYRAADIAVRLSSMRLLIETAHGLFLAALTLNPTQFRRHSIKLITLIEIARTTLNVAGLQLYTFSYCPDHFTQHKRIFANLLKLIKRRFNDLNSAVRNRARGLLLYLSEDFTIRRRHQSRTLGQGPELAEATTAQIGYSQSSDLSGSKCSAASSSCSRQQRRWTRVSTKCATAMVPQRPECDKSGSNLEADSPLERAQFSDLLDALDKHSCHGAERPRSCEKGVQIASGHYAECVKSSTGLQGSLVAVRKASTGPRCSGTQLDAGKAEPGRQPRSLRCEGEPDSVSDIGKSHCDGQVVEVVQAIQKKKKDSKTIPVDESRLSQHLTSSLDATALSKLMPPPPLPNEGINPSTQRLTSGAYNPYAKRNKLHPKIPSTTRKHQIDPIEEEMLIESTDTDMDPDFSDSDESTSTESQDSPVTQYPVWHRPRMGTFGIFCTGKKSMLGGGSGGPSSYKRGGIAPQRFRQVAGSRAAQA